MRGRRVIRDLQTQIIIIERIAANLRIQLDHLTELNGDTFEPIGDAANRVVDMLRKRT
jgi:hypothetical protein